MTVGRRRLGNPLISTSVDIPKDVLDELDMLAIEFKVPRVAIVRLALKEFIYRVKRDKRERFLLSHPEIQKVRERLPEDLKLRLMEKYNIEKVERKGKGK